MISSEKFRKGSRIILSIFCCVLRSNFIIWKWIIKETGVSLIDQFLGPFLYIIFTVYIYKFNFVKIYLNVHNINVSPENIFVTLRSIEPFTPLYCRHARSHSNQMSKYNNKFAYLTVKLNYDDLPLRRIFKMERINFRISKIRFGRINGDWLTACLLRLITKLEKTKHFFSHIPKLKCKIREFISKKIDLTVYSKSIKAGVKVS